MIRVTLYQNTNQKIAEAYQKWYPRVVAEETIGLDELAEHMASHNTPFSKGAIKGILTDAVVCTKELLLLGKNVKFPDLAIFSIGLRVKGGSDTKEDWTVSKYIEGLRLRARATGKLKTSNLDTTIKRIDLAASSSSSSSSSGSSSSDDSGTSKDDADKSNPSGGTSSGETSGGETSGGETSGGGSGGLD